MDIDKSDQSVTVEYTMDLEHVKYAARIARGMFARLPFIVALALMLIVFWFISLSMIIWNDWVIGTLGVIVHPVLLYWLYRKTGWSVIAKYKKEHPNPLPVRLTFDKTGLTAHHTDGPPEFAPWRAIQWFSRTNSHFVIIVAGNFFFLPPFSAFKEQTDIDLVESWAKDEAGVYDARA